MKREFAINGEHMPLSNYENEQLAKLKVVLDAARCHNRGRVCIETMQIDPHAKCILDVAILIKLLREGAEV